MSGPHDAGIAPQCWTCAHLMPLEPGYGWRCAAFPERIPKVIMVNMVDHREPYPDDNGVRWTPREDLRSDDGLGEVLAHVEHHVRSIAASGPRIDEENTSADSPSEEVAAPPIRRAAGVLFVTTSEPRQTLLLRRAKDGPCDFPDTWSIPGGGIEGDETAAEAAAREAEEETGRAIKPEELVEWTRQVALGTDFITFLCQVDEPFEVKLCDEHDASDWVDLDGLINATLPQLKNAA